MTAESEFARRAIGLVDLTDLSDDASVGGIDELCGRARTHGTAAVCVWPDFVEQASSSLAGSPVRVATVVNFPTGDERPFAVEVITEHVIRDGADEVDLVLPYRAFLADEPAEASDMVRRIRDVAGRDITLKVILETGEFTDLASVRRASALAIEHGADFIKTSTGKSRVSATPAAVDTMLNVIAESDRPVGIKPSGGIRTTEDAALYLGLADQVMGEGWAAPDTFRFGASGLLDALLATIDGLDGAVPTSSSY